MSLVEILEEESSSLMHEFMYEHYNPHNLSEFEGFYDSGGGIGSLKCLERDLKQMKFKFDSKNNIEYFIFGSNTTVAERYLRNPFIYDEDYFWMKKMLNLNKFIDNSGFDPVFIPMLFDSFKAEAYNALGPMNPLVGSYFVRNYIKIDPKEVLEEWNRNLKEGFEVGLKKLTLDVVNPSELKEILSRLNIKKKEGFANENPALYLFEAQVYSLFYNYAKSLKWKKEFKIADGKSAGVVKSRYLKFMVENFKKAEYKSNGSNKFFNYVAERFGDSGLVEFKYQMKKSLNLFKQSFPEISEYL